MWKKNVLFAYCVQQLPQAVSFCVCSWQMFRMAASKGLLVIHSSSANTRCQFFFGISSQHLHISNCSEPKTAFLALLFPADMHAFMRVHSHVYPLHFAQPFLPAKSRGSGRMTRLFALKGSKDNLPGLEKPSVPAIPDCFGGVSINTK